MGACRRYSATRRVSNQRPCQRRFLPANVIASIPASRAVRTVRTAIFPATLRRQIPSRPRWRAARAGSWPSCRHGRYRTGTRIHRRPRQSGAAPPAPLWKENPASIPAARAHVRAVRPRCPLQRGQAIRRSGADSGIASARWRFRRRPLRACRDGAGGDSGQARVRAPRFPDRAACAAADARSAHESPRDAVHCAPVLRAPQAALRPRFRCGCPSGCRPVLPCPAISARGPGGWHRSTPRPHRRRARLRSCGPCPPPAPSWRRPHAISRSDCSIITRPDSAARNDDSPQDDVARASWGVRVSRPGVPRSQHRDQRVQTMKPVRERADRPAVPSQPDCRLTIATSEQRRTSCRFRRTLIAILRSSRTAACNQLPTAASAFRPPYGLHPPPADCKDESGKHATVTPSSASTAVSMRSST